MEQISVSDSYGHHSRIKEQKTKSYTKFTSVELFCVVNNERALISRFSFCYKHSRCLKQIDKTE